MARKKNLTEAAQDVTSRFFSGTASGRSESRQEGRQPVVVEKSSTVRETLERAAQAPQMRRVTGRGKRTDDTKVFSFRSWIDEVDDWRLYAVIKGIKIDELGAAAMREYIKRHPITEDESALRDALLTVRQARK